MPIASYAVAPDREYWSRVWTGEDLDRLLAVAERDPLSGHLEAHLPPSGLILEGGCGLGQYVLYFRERGYQVVGGDFSLAALQAHRREHPGAPLAVMDLRALPLAYTSLAAYISLGVIEHLPGGPQPILTEMARALKPGGVALVSVPWVNGLRRLLRPLVAYRQARNRRAGLPFYQYYYTRRELKRQLHAAGLSVRAFLPYSPGKGLREFLPRRARRSAQPGPVSPAPVGREPAARRLLYWPPVLAMTAHMILAVAVKTGDPESQAQRTPPCKP